MTQATLVRVEDSASFLASLEQAKAYLASCARFNDAKAIRDKAEAMLVWSRARDDARELEVAAGELGVLADLRMAELLPDRVTKSEAGAMAHEQSHRATADLGKSDAHRLRKLGEIGRKKVEEKVAEIKARGEVPRRATIIREVKKAVVVEQLATVAAQHAVNPTGLYDVAVIDPPWPIEKIERDVRPNQVELDYPTMTLEEIKAITLPLADDAHVWLWTTPRFLPASFEILQAWGLKYVAPFVWHKPGGFQPIGLPQYNCEFALYARKGSPVFLDTKALPLCFEAPRGAHSEKPESFYEVLRRVTGGRRLDMFNRRKIEGFDGWGNQAQ